MASHIIGDYAKGLTKKWDYMFVLELRLHADFACEPRPGGLAC